MNVTDQFMMQQMQQMAAGMANLPKSPNSVKQEANETFQDLIQQKQQEVVKSEKEIVPEKKTSPKESEPQAADKPQQEPAAEKPQQEPVKDEEQTLAETGYIPAEILLANQLVQAQPEMQTETVEAAVPVVEAEESAALAVQPEMPQGPSVAQEQDAQPQTQQQEQSAQSFDRQLEETAQPQPEQTVQAQPRQARTEAAEQETGPQPQQEQEDAEVLSVQEAPEAPLFRDVERAPVKVGEPEQVDARQPDLDVQLTQKIQQALQQGAQRVEIRLTPENLGALTIQMTRNVDGSLQVVLHTANEKAMSLLSQHAEQMTILLQGGGQQVQLEVRQNEESQQANQQNQQNQQQADADGHNQSQQRQPKHQERQHQSQDFIQQMRLGLIQEGV